MKNIKTATVAFIIFAVCSLPSLAQNDPVAQQYVNQIKIGTLRDRAVAEVNGRVTMFSSLAAQVANLKNVSSAEKLKYTDRLRSILTELSQLQEKIKKDETPQDITTDKQAISKTYKSYLFYLPMVRMLSFADDAITLGEEMKANTSNVDSLNKIKAADATSKQTITLLLGLTPEEYPANKQTLVVARVKVKEILQDLLDARKTIQ